MTSAVPADRNLADTAIPGEPDSGHRSGAAAPARDGRSPRDMATALLVLLVPILLVIGAYRIFLDGDQPTVVDPAPTVAEARAAGAFPVAEPTGLDRDWRPVSAVFRRAADGATLRLGYVSPSGGGVQLVQSSLPVAQLLPTELSRTLPPEGITPVDGRDWQRYPARPGERALVLLEPGRTVIAVGAVSERELRDLVDALG